MQQPSPAVAHYPTGGGGAAATTTVVVQRNGPNHVLHLVLTLVTLGLWLPIWILIAIFGNRRSTVVTSAAAGGGGAAPVQYNPQPPEVGFSPVPQHLAPPTSVPGQIWDRPPHVPLEAGEAVPARPQDDR